MRSYHLIMAAESLLETVATHESTLMKELEQAREEARQLVDTAHAEGASIQQEVTNQLEEEVSMLRREAAQARESERSTIQQQTASAVESIRTQSASRADSVRSELIARIIPSID